MALTSILIFLALIHIYWLFGEFGIEQTLPTNKNGDKLLNPSKFIIMVIAFILFAFAWVSYRLDVESHALWIDTMGWVLALLFFLRGIGDFRIVGIFKKVKYTEFAKFDNWIYIPLCFMLSFGFIWKVI